MNSDQLGQLLHNTVVNVLEEAVYALIDKDQQHCAADTPVVESLVSFTGTYTGTIALEVEAIGVEPLTNDFLGSDGSPLQAGANDDAMGELANIIAGRLLEAWLPQETNYDIGIPSVSSKIHSQTHLVNEPHVCEVKLRTDSGFHIAAAVLLGVWS